MNTSSLNRIGGIAAILGILLLFGGYAIPALLGIGMLLMALFYYALDKSLGSSPLGLAAVGSTVVGGIGALFTGTDPSTLFNIFNVLAFMLPALLAGLAARGKAGFPRFLPIFGIIGGALGIVNAIVNISGGGDWTNLSSPTLTLLSNLTYYPALLLVLVWLVWGGVLLLRDKGAAQSAPA
ncbi:MAG: hypothetical protein HUU23_16575 [Caldilineales bacterium]|nr:hypothetical protein [Caldilineales bacterium]